MFLFTHYLLSMSMFHTDTVQLNYNEKELYNFKLCMSVKKEKSQMQLVLNIQNIIILTCKHDKIVMRYLMSFLVISF